MYVKLSKVQLQAFFRFWSSWIQELGPPFCSIHSFSNQTTFLEVDTLSIHGGKLWGHTHKKRKWLKADHKVTTMSAKLSVSFNTASWIAVFFLTKPAAAEQKSVHFRCAVWCSAVVKRYEFCNCWLSLLKTLRLLILPSCRRQCLG